MIIRAAVVVAVVAAAAGGCGDDDPAPLDVATSPSLEVIATEMSYTPDEVAVVAGTVTVVLHNEGAILHDLRIGEEPFIVEAVAGETSTATVSLDAGRYRLFCSLPGHAEGGMEGTLEVR